MGDNSPFDRAIMFLDQFIDLPANAEVEIRTGIEEKSGDKAIGITLNGRTHFFILKEATQLADLLEETGKKFPQEARSYANTIMAIRETVRRLDGQSIRGGQ